MSGPRYVPIELDAGNTVAQVMERGDDGTYRTFVVLTNRTSGTVGGPPSNGAPGPFSNRGNAKRIARALNALDVADRRKAREAKARRKESA